MTTESNADRRSNMTCRLFLYAGFAVMFTYQAVTSVNDGRFGSCVLNVCLLIALSATYVMTSLRDLLTDKPEKAVQP